MMLNAAQQYPMRPDMTIRGGWDGTPGRWRGCPRPLCSKRQDSSTVRAEIDRHMQDFVITSALHSRH